MHHVLAKAGIFALAFLIMLVFAAMASLGVSLSAVSLRPTAPSPGEIVASTPAEIVASRFPFADAALPIQPAAFSTASVMPVERWERLRWIARVGWEKPRMAPEGRILPLISHN